MNNRVVFALFQAFQKRGYSVLRFNFRGGEIAGAVRQWRRRTERCASALDWMQGVNPNASGCWIGGYSFGAWIGMQLLMRRPEIDGFIAVSPPAGSLDFSFLAPCPASGLILHGARDDVVPPGGGEAGKEVGPSEKRGSRFQGDPRRRSLLCLHMTELTKALDDYLNKALATTA